MAIELAHAPLGELAASQLVAEVAKLGDLAERHYLEIKGPLDLSGRKDKAKIAKFILGAANRLPEVASTAFGGYGVMLVGITDNRVEGVPPIEMMELAKVIQPFLGAKGPRWDVVRVPVNGSPSQVLVVLVDPPQPGQDPFPCRANGDGLVDGRIYMRAEGATREATGEELILLMQRGKTGTQAPVELEVGLVGEVVPVFVDEAQTLDAFLTRGRQRLLDALPKPQPPRPNIQPANLYGDSLSRTVGGLNLASFGALIREDPENRTQEEYLAEIEAWEEAMRAAWPAVISRFAGYVFAAPEVRVANSTNTFLHDVEVSIHLEGTVKAVKNFSRPNNLKGINLNLPRSPRVWGPVKHDFGIPKSVLNSAAAMTQLNSQNYVPSRSTWHNTGSVDIRVSVGDLRPDATFVTDDENSVLVLHGGQVSGSVHGTWKATIRGYNEVFEGELIVEVDEVKDLTTPMRRRLNLE